MSDDSIEYLYLHKGVWIDIFYFIRRSKIPFIANFQVKLMSTFIHIGDGFTEWSKNKNSENPRSDLKFKLFNLFPHSLITLFRRFLLVLMSLLSSKNSDSAVISWWPNYRTINTKISYIRPLTKHKFEDREFSVPENYDGFLSFTYGDYMTPVSRTSHVNLENIEL